ncbi:MAG: hypothetical protein QM763_11565 [Agriterribacter sp.]
MDLRKDIINKLLSDVDGGLLSIKYAPQDVEYEYILDGINLNIVTIDLGDGQKEEMDIYDSGIARFFQYDFITNATQDEKAEAIYLHYLREKFVKIFYEADEKGYNEFVKKIEERIEPFQKTDIRVSGTIWKILNESTSRKDSPSIKLNDDDIDKHGYKNGWIRKAAEIIRDNPDMFVSYPNLLLKNKAIDHAKDYYFFDAFWSRAAYAEAIKALSPDFLSNDGQTWYYRQKGNKTAFIALFEELYTKNYLKKRLSEQEMKNIALNSFGLDISSRTFKEGSAIIKAIGLFKFLPVHKR